MNTTDLILFNQFCQTKNMRKEPIPPRPFDFNSTTNAEKIYLISVHLLHSRRSNSLLLGQISHSSFPQKEGPPLQNGEKKTGCHLSHYSLLSPSSSAAFPHACG